MPLRHMIILLASVIAAAGLTVFLVQGILTPTEAIIGYVIMACLMSIRVLLARK